MNRKKRNDFKAQRKVEWCKVSCQSRFETEKSITYTKKLRNC